MHGACCQRFQQKPYASIYVLVTKQVLQVELTLIHNRRDDVVMPVIILFQATN